MNAPVKIACIQMHAEFQKKQENLNRAEHFIRDACANGANLLVLPEFFTGTSSRSRAEAYAQAEPIPAGETTRRLLELSAEYGVYICGSFLEQDGVDLYNTSVLTGPEGFIGKYRKLQLCGDETYYYEPGNLGIPVFHTKLGRIALLICLDTYYPETFRIAAMQGADIVCASYHGMDLQKARSLPDNLYTPIPILCMANALSNHMYVVGCNRVGNCNGYQAAGQSIIANPYGAPVGPVAPYDQEVILYAEVDLCDTRRRYIDATNSRIANRRTDVYDSMLGYDPAHWPKQAGSH